MCDNVARWRHIVSLAISDRNLVLTLSRKWIFFLLGFHFQNWHYRKREWCMSATWCCGCTLHLRRRNYNKCKWLRLLLDTGKTIRFASCRCKVHFSSSPKCINLILFKWQAGKIYTEQVLEIHRGQGMEIFWRDNFICPTESEYKEMAILKTGGLFTLVARLMQLFTDSEKDLTRLAALLAVYYQIREDYCSLLSEKVWFRIRMWNPKIFMSLFSAFGDKEFLWGYHWRQIQFSNYSCIER